MASWRCMNSRCGDPAQRPGFDFEAEGKVVKCPKCGLSSDDVRFGGMLLKLTVIHYDPPHPIVGGAGLGYPLCEPSARVQDLHRKKEAATGEPGVVNCKKCLAHVDFPKEWEEMALSRVPNMMMSPLPE